MIEKQKKSGRDAHALAFSAPCAGELMSVVQAIHLGTPVLDVLTLFHNNVLLPAFPVVDENNHYFDIITRRNYFNIMSRAYARELGYQLKTGQFYGAVRGEPVEPWAA